ncbi:hypothetical protein CJJ23_03515 [Mycoplasmopsis agassizii]|uniref:RDD domain-containing protein n=1 Tax=Mycoplasmopsis agassizii TaxID=33922 RepID=A0A269TI75_9BACT|nr:RDD family protein [Mycoplasmopsis agassizii]PAK21182.1 hypothetical protein CJJ23_03515 [Mycoplasmopsis agassizii]
MYKKANYFLRLGVFVIDVGFNALVIWLLSFIIKIENDLIEFNSYYIFLATSIIELFIYFYIVPLIFKNRTLSLWIWNLSFRTFEGDSITYKKLVKRQAMLSGAIIFTFIVLMAAVSPDLANKVKNKVEQTYWEQVLYALPSGFAGVIIIFSFINIMTSMFSISKISIVDRIHKSTLYTNKKVIEVSSKELKIIFHQHKKIIWEGNENV